MGNAVITISEFMNAGSKSKTRGTGTLSTSYARGGETITARQFGLGQLDSLVIHPAAGLYFEDDLTNLKIRAYATRPQAASLGAALTAYATGAPGAGGGGGAVRVLTNNTGGYVDISPPFCMLLNTAAQDTAAAISSSATGTFLSCQGATVQAGFNLYLAGGATSLLIITASTAFNFSQPSFIALSDGGMIPVTFDTSAGYQVYCTNTASNSWATFRSTSAAGATSAGVAVNVSTALGMVMPLVAGTTSTVTGANQYELPAGQNLSAVTFRWEAFGPGS